MPLLPTPDLYQADLWAHKKIGLLGGSFNPAHEGHRHISLIAMQKLNLDAVWWMITPQNPLKSDHETQPLKERIKSAEAAAQYPHIYPTGIEAKLKTKYTSDTLPKLKSYFPKTHFVWIMGMDNLHNIHEWEKWQEIFYTMPIAVMSRPPHDDHLQSAPATQTFKKHQIPEHKAQDLLTSPLPSWCILTHPLNHQSSTNIRQQKNDN